MTRTEKRWMMEILGTKRMMVNPDFRQWELGNGSGNGHYWVFLSMGIGNENGISINRYW